MKHIYFIDSENVNDAWLSLLDCTEPEDEILVFYTKKSPHMGYEGIRKLKESDREVTFIRCFEGQNALDFQLVSEVGYRLNGGSDEKYIIVTNDTGYDAMVHYWKEKNYPVERMTGKRCMALGTRMKSQQEQAAKSVGAAEENKLPQGIVPVDAQPKDAAGARQSAAEAEGMQKPDAPSGQQDIVASGQALQIQAVVTGTPGQGNAAAERAVQIQGAAPAETDWPQDFAVESAGAHDLIAEAERPQDASVETDSLQDASTKTKILRDSFTETGSLQDSFAETGSSQDSFAETDSSQDSFAETDSLWDSATETDSLQDLSVETKSPQNFAVETENSRGAASAFEVSQNADSGCGSPQNADGGYGVPQNAGRGAKKAKAEKPQETAAEAEKPQVDFDEKEVQTILSCIGRNKLEDLHNSLSMIYGEKGKDIYQIVRSPSYSIKENSWNQKEKFKRYCGVIFVHSDISKPYPKDFSEFLYTAADKRKNLNSLRAALQSKYGKEKGMKYYSTFKGHIKLMNHM